MHPPLLGTRTHTDPVLVYLLNSFFFNLKKGEVVQVHPPLWMNPMYYLSNPLPLSLSGACIEMKTKGKFSNKKIFVYLLILI